MTQRRPPSRLRITRDQLAPYLDLARQVAASRAEATFLDICTTPGWDRQDMEEASAAVLSQIERVIREALDKQGGDLDEEAWDTLRETIAEAFLDRLMEADEAAGPETPRTAQ